MFRPNNNISKLLNRFTGILYKLHRTYAARRIQRYAVITTFNYDGTVERDCVRVPRNLTVSKSLRARSSPRIPSETIFRAFARRDALRARDKEREIVRERGREEKKERKGNRGGARPPVDL